MAFLEWIKKNKILTGFLILALAIGIYFLITLIIDKNKSNNNITPSTTFENESENTIVENKKINEDEILNNIEDNNSLTTTLPPLTTTIPPLTTTLPPLTTTLPPLTTTLPPKTTPPPPTTQEPFLFPFTTYTFTSAFKSNHRVIGGNYYYYRNSAGPTLNVIRDNYITFNGYLQWIMDDKFFNMKDNNGIQLWTVPVSGYYDINAVGASGGAANNFGKGRDIKVNTFLKKGEIIKILVGQIGVKTQNYNSCSSGGGGTFVVRDKETPIIIAGGGGGSGCFYESPNSDASDKTSGNNGSGNKDFGLGGENGQGGTSRPLKYMFRDTWSKIGSGGGGLLGNGKAETEDKEGGKAFINGGYGGNCSYNIMHSPYGCAGGFGGGGAYTEVENGFSIGGYRGQGGGGGGGYSGGGEGGVLVDKNGWRGEGGGGGGSYALSEFIDNGAKNIGDGSVTITLTNITPIAITKKPILPIINNDGEENEFDKIQRELEEAIRRQKEKEKEELFNIPLIPVFNSNDTLAVIPSEGFYNIYAFGGLIMPMNNTTPSSYSHGGTLGNLFDNNISTGVFFSSGWNEADRWTPVWENNSLNWSKYRPGVPHIIVITMPVFKTFKGRIKINTYNQYTGWGTPTKISVNTAQSLNMSSLNNNNTWLDEYTGRYVKGRSYAKEYVESSILDINRDFKGEQSFNLDFKIKFNTIIIEILERNYSENCFIADIGFEKSR